MSEIHYFTRSYLCISTLVRILFSFLFLCCMAAAQTPESKQGQEARQPKNILVLYSFSDSQLFAPLDSLKLAIREKASEPVTFFVEYLETQRLEDPTYEKTLSENFKSVYRSKRLDLVIAAAYPALHFALTHRNELFPGVPVVFNHLNARRIPEQGVWPGVTGVTITVDISGSLDLILRLQPDTKDIAVIAGTVEFERFWASAAQTEIESRPGNLHVINLLGLTPDELMKRVSELPPHTAALFIVMPRISEQPVMGSYEVARAIGDRVPTYCLFQHYCVDRGGIGGSISDYEEQNVQTAALVSRIFDGEPVETIAVIHDSGARPVVDWRHLNRWKISESRLPPGSVVLYRPSTFWQDHKALILASFGLFILQLALILGLLRERAAKNVKGVELSESEVRFRVLADSSPTLIWMSNENGEKVYLNQTTSEFTGAAPEALRNGGWQALIHPEDLPQVLAQNSAALLQRKAFSEEFRLRRRDGVYRWVFDVAAPRYQKNGSFAGFIGSTIDVTDQKSATESLEALGGRLIQAQERERSAIARELHDDICQRLAILAFKIEQTMNDQDMAPVRQHEAMEEAREQCSKLAGDVQTLSHELHSSILDHLGISAAVENFCQEFAKLHNVRVEFTQRNVADFLPRELSLSLFRILQEALRNAHKHSGANQFFVGLEETQAEVILEIRDQGVGFDPQKAGNKGGIGLISMEERANLLHGKLMIESGASLGTTIRVSVPIKRSTATVEKKVAASANIAGGPNE